MIQFNIIILIFDVKKGGLSNNREDFLTGEFIAIFH